MSKLPSILCILLAIGWFYLLNQRINLAPGKKLPPIGKFLSPFTGFWKNADPIANLESKKMNLKGIKGSIEIKWDDRLVPHISAQNSEDLMFAQGFVTAANRLWQMDVASRATAGRLSEVMGSRTLLFDKNTRRKGMAIAAEHALSAWKKDAAVMKMINSYTAGVNAWISELKPADYPIEFKLLDYQPEPWTDLKVAMLATSMANTLSTQEYDLENTNALKIFGSAEYNYLYAQPNKAQVPIIPAGTKWDYVQKMPAIGASVIDTAIGYLSPFEKTPFDDPHIGSNNWAVGPNKTKEHHPILCSDPHLTLTLPSIWYEVQLSSPEVNCYGASLPGAPGIIIGFNEKVAWGITNTEWDVLDWYSIKWQNDSKTKYLLDGKTESVSYRVEKIVVRDSMEIIDSVKYTSWGPVVSEDQKNPKYGLAMRWLAHNWHNPDELMAFVGMNQAENYNDYYNATSKHVVPSQNMVFASTDGDIAMRILGRMPHRAQGEGLFVMDGSVSSNGYKELLPAVDNPYTRNPAQGYVASANQNTTAADYPFAYIGNYDDYRGRYLNRRLTQMDSITVEDMMKLQNDPYSILAEDALPALIKATDRSKLSGQEQLIYDQLAKWNCRFVGKGSEATMFMLWWTKFKENTWDEMYGIIDSIPILIPENYRTIEILNTNPSYVFFDMKQTTVKETASDIAMLSFKEALAEFTKFAADPINDKGSWSQYKHTTIDHMGKIPAFGSKIIEVDGFKDALNATQRFNGPSWRMIVQLSTPVKAWGVYPGGQSGNPGSKYYDNMIETWRTGNYNDLVFLTKEQPESDKIIANWQLTKNEN